MKHRMIPQRVAATALLLAMVALSGVGGPGLAENAQGTADKRQTGKPQLKLRANPAFGYPPLRVVFTAELTGGADDYEDYYCAKVEWDWADGSTSSFSYDCDPYEAGTSQIRRRFAADHTFNLPGRVDVTFRLKQGSKVVAFVRTPVTISGELAEVLRAVAPVSRSRQ